MGQASSSASASTGTNATGGQANINPPNYGMYIVVVVAMILGAVLFIKRKK